jgi:predicted dienelactone hydrolase
MFKLRLKSFFLVLVLSLLALPAAAYFDPQYRDIGDRQTAIWWWGKSEEKKPLILFSHGFTGCNDQAGYLASALAEAGYIFVGVNHRDAGCKSTFNPVNVTQQDPYKPELWLEDVYADRVEDFRKVLEGLRADKYYSTVIDFDKVGFVGNSLGGYVALGVAGGWPGWRLPGVKAVMAAAPYVMPYFHNGGFKNIQIPVMFQLGTRDPGVTDIIAADNGAFKMLTVPAYLVNFEGAPHEAWSKQNDRYHASIIHYTRAFFDSILRGQSKDPLLEKLPNVAQLENNAELLKTGQPGVLRAAPTTQEALDAAQRALEEEAANPQGAEPVPADPSLQEIAPAPVSPEAMPPPAEDIGLEPQN